MARAHTNSRFQMLCLFLRFYHDGRACNCEVQGDNGKSMFLRRRFSAVQLQTPNTGAASIVDLAFRRSRDVDY
jgi:hypothetical protein